VLTAGQPDDAGGGEPGESGRDPSPLVDLDTAAPAEPAPAPRRWPGATKPWPPTLLLAAVVATALLSGLLTAGALEQREQADRHSTVRLLASLTYPSNGPVRVAPDRVRMELVLLNAGPEPVTVSEAMVHGSRTQVLLAHSHEVNAGRSSAVEVTVAPDCSALLTDRLTLVVTTADGQTREVPVDELGHGLGVQLGQLQQFCDGGAPEPIPVWRTSVEADGSLALHLRNIRSIPAQLTAVGPPGTRLVGDPPLPLTLPTDRSVVVRLRVVVDRCTFAAQRPDAGSQIELKLDGEDGGVNPDPPTLVGWFAQQVVRACQ
jgi:hypothetical protein